MDRTRVMASRLPAVDRQLHLGAVQVGDDIIIAPEPVLRNIAESSVRPRVAGGEWTVRPGV